MQRLGNEFFGNERPVGVSGIDQRNPELHRAPEHGETFLAILRFAPNAFAGELHRAKAETMDWQVSADFVIAAFGGGVFRGAHG